MNVIVFFALALGGLSHFKQIGLNPITTAIKVGVELFMIQGLMALCINMIDTINNEITQNSSVEIILTILTTALIFCMITKMVRELLKPYLMVVLAKVQGLQQVLEQLPQWQQELRQVQPLELLGLLVL